MFNEMGYGLQTEHMSGFVAESMTEICVDPPFTSVDNVHCERTGHQHSVVSDFPITYV